MARQARYENIEDLDMDNEEKHLLKRIEELEERLDRVGTVLTEHKHEDNRVVCNATWAL